jgi:uncharacterized membrane protein YqjE
VAVESARSTAEVVKDVTANAQTIIRKELELARIEMQEGVRAQLMGAALFALAGLLGLFVLGFAGVTVAVALQNVVERWAAWLIVTVAFALIAVVAVLVGKRVAANASFSPVETKRSMEENIAWAKQQIGR